MDQRPNHDKRTKYDIEAAAARAVIRGLHNSVAQKNMILTALLRDATKNIRYCMDALLW